MLGELISGNLNFTSVIIHILSAVAVIFLTMPIHEFAHGFVADKLGDPTPRYQGRLTLNPLAHIDYIGSLCILLFGFGWAKPVQVNSYNFKKPKRDMALVALAGPVSNLLVAFVSFILINLIFVITNSLKIYYLVYFFYYVAELNVYLAVFNLIPIPPLDGSRIWAIVLPDKYYYKLMQYERYIYYILLALLFFGVLDLSIGRISTSLISIISNIANLPFKLLGVI